MVIWAAGSLHKRRDGKVGGENSNLQGDNLEVIIDVGKSEEGSEEMMTAGCSLFATSKL
jgi:hypothetical protein